ncbi:homoserine O-succinyltransferase MetX [Hellea balneolensis]|uniref:homoserine O-succinyltransferase MetX n=1 Tax=Hellea balneolensis TaxID=287478 RepID=UPI0004042C2F|nr:homoserine O-succinyltransferase [Hellea balneolensis]
MPRDIKVSLGDNVLQRGCVLKDDVVMGRLYGNKDGPVIVVMGGISASRFIADGGRLNRGWWSTLVRGGGPIDLNTFQVIGMDFAPAVESDNRPDSITTHDQAARLKALLDAQGISKVAAIIGSSYGGMTALAFAHDYPDAVGQLCVIGAAHKPYPIGVAWRGIQRRAVRLGIEAGRPKEGMKLARELAMTTYRTAEEFADRFALEETATSPSKFDICDYLGSRGDAFAELMDAERFLALSESIDLHRVEPEAITTPTLLMSAISDQLAPLTDMRELRDRLGGPSELFTFTSLYGHDAFLKEYDAMSPRLAEFCGGLV